MQVTYLLLQTKRILASPYICFLQLILSNRPPIWPGRDKRFSAIELASFTGCR